MLPLTLLGRPARLRSRARPRLAGGARPRAPRRAAAERQPVHLRGARPRASSASRPGGPRRRPSSRPRLRRMLRRRRARRRHLRPDAPGHRPRDARSGAARSRSASVRVLLLARRPEPGAAWRRTSAGRLALPAATMHLPDYVWASTLPASARRGPGTAPASRPRSASRSSPIALCVLGLARARWPRLDSASAWPSRRCASARACASTASSRRSRLPYVVLPSACPASNVMRTPGRFMLLGAVGFALGAGVGLVGAGAPPPVSARPRSSPSPAALAAIECWPRPSPQTALPQVPGVLPPARGRRRGRAGGPRSAARLATTATIAPRPTCTYQTVHRHPIAVVAPVALRTGATRTRASIALWRAGRAGGPAAARPPARRSAIATSSCTATRRSSLAAGSRTAASASRSARRTDPASRTADPRGVRRRGARGTSTTS